MELAAADGVDLQRSHQVLELELDARMPLAERAQDGGQDLGERRADEADYQASGAAVRGAAGRAHRLLDVAQDLARFLEEGGAGLGQLDAPAAAVEQPRADLVLELPDLLAE